MTLTALALLYLIILAYGVRYFAITGAVAMDGDYNYAEPRAQQTRLTGKAARAQASHQNSLEAFAPFAVGLILAHLSGVDPGLRLALTLSFCGLRTVFVIGYVAGWGQLRSAVWVAGMLITLALYILSAISS